MRIVDQSKGIFLWAVLVVEDLFQIGSTEAEVEDALRHLPTGNQLFDLIFQIVLKIPKHNQERARDMITFTINSRRNLAISELAALMAVRRSQRFEDIAQNTSISMERDIQTICRSLLSCENGFVRPFHLTIRDFFHGELCPQQFKLLPLPSSNDFPPAEPLKYAVDSFLYHTIRAPEVKQMALVTPIRTFMWSKSSFTRWFQFIWEHGNSLRLLLRSMQRKSALTGEQGTLLMPEKVTPIHVLALLVNNTTLLTKVAFSDMDYSWFSLNDVDSEGRTVIHWAAGQEGIQGHFPTKEISNESEIISNLVSRGLDPNRVAINGRSPLHIVVQGGRHHNLRALVRQGVDVNVQDQNFFRPLHLTVRFATSSDLIHLSISADATVDARDKDEETPLHHAAIYNYTEAINALTAANATVDARDEIQCTPLHIAALHNHTEAINALIAANATVDARAADQSTPLLNRRLFTLQLHKTTQRLLMP
ncbi:hypothetical protein BP5796_12530 [Coleophoma crateriformis]|uniref:Uncharacterized protein n=1 Tax=Coleophoma crateriformis TaxID=565419 RepID=A0A3D8Q7F2_9HELO|nr:hypothetical protein BP5796_12530 [Coleophoma crateriformis]